VSRSTRAAGEGAGRGRAAARPLPPRPGAFERSHGKLLADPPPIRVTGSDRRRLEALLGNFVRSTSAVVSYLDRELARAVPCETGAAPVPFVRMGSRVRFADGEGGTCTATLVFPQDLPATPDGISILSPVGAALLGLAEEQAIAYETPDGRGRIVTVVEILSDGSLADA
jgi:regulator of nucleoside diphosphate kinase